MATSRQFLIAASISAAALMPAQARAQSNNSAAAVRNAAVRVSPAPTVSAALEDAMRLMTEGRFKDARRAYRTIVSQQRADGEYPIDALQGLARAAFALNDNRGTAAALDELAAAADKFGDPETRLRSLFDAALVYQGLGDRDQVVDHLPEIRMLLKSPVIAEATRSDIGGRIPKA
jgi:hypothetical protein